MGNRSANSAWVRFFCGKDRRGRMATFTKVGPEWQLSAVSTDAPERSSAGRLPVVGRFGISAAYKGCPRCGSNSYVRCDSCGELSCWASASRNFTCGNCGVKGEVRHSIESVNAVDAG